MRSDQNNKRIELLRTEPRTVEVLRAASEPPLLDPQAAELVQLEDVTAPLRHGKLAIAIAALSGALLGWGSTLLIPPVYRSHVSLQLESFNSESVLKNAPVSSSLPNSSPENYLRNQVKLLESETLARRVAARLGPAPPAAMPVPVASLLAWFRDLAGLGPAPVAAPETELWRKVRKAMSVRTSMQSQVVDLFYDAPSPARAARGADTAAAEFIAMNREARWQLALDTTEWLSRQAADLKSSLEASNQQLQAFAHAQGLVFAGRQSTLAEEQMRQLQDSLGKAQAECDAKRALYEAAMANPDTVTSGPAGGPIQQYQTELQNLQRQLAQLESLYTPSNHKVLQVQAQIAETQKSIEKERSAILTRLRTEYTAASKYVQLLGAAFSRQMKTVQQQMDQERKYELKKGEIEATQRLYESMVAKAKDAGAASTLRTTNVRVIDPAGAPAKPYSPNPLLNAAIGLALGSLAGIGFVYARENSGRFRRPAELVRCELPVLGAIPSAGEARCAAPLGKRLIGFGRSAGDLKLGNLQGRNWLLAESFQATLTSILFSRPLTGSAGATEGGRVVVVTSVDVKEGKTTVLVNLGVSAAERRQRVLLIDADLRRPRVHELVGVPNTWGLLDLLQPARPAGVLDESKITDFARPTSVEGLWVLPAGRVRPGSQKLLYSQDVSALVRRLRWEFDLILIDTPPVMLYSEARVLGKLSDGVVMVVRANSTAADEVRTACGRLIQEEIPILGVILNDFRMDPLQKRAYRRYHRHYGDQSV